MGIQEIITSRRDDVRWEGGSVFMVDGQPDKEVKAGDSYQVGAGVPHDVKNGAAVISPTGTRFTEDSIGEAVAGRDLMDQLRQMGVATGGPAAFTPADRSRFLARLGEAVHTIRVRRPGPG